MFLNRFLNKNPFKIIKSTTVTNGTLCTWNDWRSNRRIFPNGKLLLREKKFDCLTKEEEEEEKKEKGKRKKKQIRRVLQTK